MRLIALDSGVIVLALVPNISRLSIYCYCWCRPTTGKHGKLTEMSRFLNPKLKNDTLDLANPISTLLCSTHHSSSEWSSGSNWSPWSLSSSLTCTCCTSAVKSVFPARAHLDMSNACHSAYKWFIFLDKLEEWDLATSSECTSRPRAAPTKGMTKGTAYLLSKSSSSGARSKREYYHNCSLVVFMCSFL